MADETAEIAIFLDEGEARAARAILGPLGISLGEYLGLAVKRLVAERRVSFEPGAATAESHHAARSARFAANAATPAIRMREAQAKTRATRARTRPGAPARNPQKSGEGGPMFRRFHAEPPKRAELAHASARHAEATQRGASALRNRFREEPTP